MLNVYQIAAKVGAYTSSSRFASRHARAVADLLLANAPSSLNAAQRKALDAVQVRAEAVDAVRRERHGASAPKVRVQRQELINAWSALHSALSALASIPPDVGNQAVEATALLSRLFPAGLSFLSGDAAALWSDTRLLFSRIEDEELQPRIDAIVTPVHLASVRAARARLGTVLGVDGNPRPRPRQTLGEVNSLFAFAVANYARALSINLDLDDEVSVGSFFAALQPLDALRVDTRPGSRSEPDVEPDAEDFEDESDDPEVNDAPVVVGPTEDPLDPLPDDPEVNPFYHPPVDA